MYFCISAFPRSRLSGIVFPSKGVSTVQFWNISATPTAALLTLFVNAADPIDWQRLTMRWTMEAAEQRSECNFRRTVTEVNKRFDSMFQE